MSNDKKGRLPKVIGYVRCSTERQNPLRQYRAIWAVYPDVEIVEEFCTGTTMDRPAWNKLVADLIPGDTIVFDSVSRMSRDKEEGVRDYMALYQRGVNLVFLNEPLINTSVYKSAAEKQLASTGRRVADIFIQAANDAMIAIAEEQIEAAFMQAQKEHDDMVERTKGGIETARLAGKQIGAVRGKKLTTKKSIEMKKVILKYNRAFSGGTYDDEATRAKCKTVGRGGKDSLISWTTYYKYKEELMDEHPELVVRRRKSTKRIKADANAAE